MKHSRTPVNWLRAFEVAARHLSFSAAATELAVTPAAVSQQVRLLEHRLGAELFTRHARGLRLTPAGESLVPACRESFERLDGALAELFGGRRRDRLVVRVALGYARGELLDALAAFSREHPDVPLRLLPSVWSAEPPDAGVDLDIHLATGAMRGRIAHRLTQDEVFPVCSPGLRRGPPRLRVPAELHTQVLLMPLGFAQGWPQWLAAAGIKRAQRPVDMEFDSMRLALEAAVRGHGVALARSSFARELLREGLLVEPFDIRLPARDEIYLSHAPGIEPGGPAAMLRDWLLQRLSPAAVQRPTRSRPARR
jgi:LysR family glycine cleavage system transcriptional activator